MEIYEHASGQKINREKTFLSFSRNTTQDLQEEIKQRFGAEVIQQHETYLGLPSLVGRSKKNTFHALKEILDNKLSGWKEKMLSQARKEILIKVVAQAIPAYTMSVFKPPDTLCDEMTSMVHSFWWGQTNRRNKMAWLAWDKVSVPKSDASLGFRNLKTFYLALLAKQGWRLQTNTHSLVHRVLKARFFPNSDFLHAKLGSKSSFAWRSIMVAQDMVKAGSRWQVGNGSSVQILLDKWLPTHSTFRVTSLIGTLPQDSRVCTLINDDTGEWKVDMIWQHLLPTDADAILRIPKS